MKRNLVTLSAFVLMLAGAAGAAEMQGEVQKADNAADTLTLKDGTLFYLGEGASMKGLKPGMAVVVTYQIQADLKIATKIVRKN